MRCPRVGLLWLVLTSAWMGPTLAKAPPAPNDKATAKAPAPNEKATVPTAKAPAPTAKAPAPNDKAPAPSAKVPAPTTLAPAPTTLAADLKAMATFFTDIEKTYAASRAPGEKKTSIGVWWMPETWCVKRLGYPKNQVMESCVVQEIGERRAAAIFAVKYCEPEHCESDYFIISGTSDVRKTNREFVGALIVSSDLTGFFVGSLGYIVPDDSPIPTGYTADLMHVNFETLESRWVANCMVPVLSPSGRWIVCRDEKGDVHRLNRAAKNMQRIHTIDLKGERIEGDAHVELNIPPVEFLADGRVRIETPTTGDTDVEFMKWRED